MLKTDALGDNPCKEHSRALTTSCSQVKATEIEGLSVHGQGLSSKGSLHVLIRIISRPVVIIELLEILKVCTIIVVTHLRLSSGAEILQCTAVVVASSNIVSVCDGCAT